MQFLIILWFVLMVLGAKPTWKFVQNLLPTSIDDAAGLVFTIIIFAVIFLVVGPIMGIITAGKYLVLKLSSKGS